MADDEEETRVTLFSHFGKVFVWNPDDAFKIRSKYRMVGSLIGSLPRKPKQNHCFSLPLLLSQAEATLLMNKGLARMFDMPKNMPAPSNEEVETFNELRCDSVAKQIELFERGREEKQMELAEIIEEGRRRKRKLKEKDEKIITLVKKKKNEESNNDTAEQCKVKEERECNQLDAEFNVDNDMKNKEETVGRTEGIEANLETPLNEKTERKSESKRKPDILKVSTNLDISHEETKALSDLGTLVHIPTIMPSQRLQSCTAVHWTYPQTETEKLHYRVFLDLWEKGYYLTSGAKFGGDLLAYPGDPMRYHSFYIVIIIPWGKKITPFEMISAGRLGATVKKTALFCSVSDETDEVMYTSIKWSGIS